MKTIGFKFWSLCLTLTAGVAAVGCGLRDPHFALLSQNQSGLSTGVVNNKVDILWVIDNSGTMGPKQTNLRSSINSFMNQFVTKNFDYHIAVITTDTRAVDPLHPNDPNYSGQHGCIVGTGVVTNATANPATAVANNANVGYFGSADAHGIDAVQMALSEPNRSGCNAGFLRSDAFLAVIEFSDADDNTSATTNGLITYLDTIKTPITTPTGNTVRNYSVSAMVVEDLTRAACVALGPFSEKGTKYLALASATAGSTASICDADFSAGLLAVGNSILESTTAIRLSQVPDTSTILVIMDGAIVANNTSDGWTFDAATNSIVFHGAALPTRAGILIAISYKPTDIVR